MNQIDIQFFKTKIGDLVLGSFDSKLCLLDFRYRKMRNSVDTRIKKGLNAEFVENTSDVIQQAKNQLDEYLSGTRKTFNLPILMVGPSFQKRVWDSLLEVPYGATATYKQLAQTIGSETAVRAVASANGANSMSLIIPCHRIIGSDGQLVGYGGGLNVKKRLLNLEKAYSNGLEISDSHPGIQPIQAGFVF